MGRKSERDRQPVAVAERRLSQVRFQALDEIPHFLGWLADLTNPDTRRPAVTSGREKQSETGTTLDIQRPSPISFTSPAPSPDFGHAEGVPAMSRGGDPQERFPRYAA